MKWFKHHTDLTRDERVASYLHDCGSGRLEGYGFLVRLIEVIAEQMTPDRPDPSLTLPLREWSRQLDCHHHKVSKYLGSLGVRGVVTIENPAGNWKVTYPELSRLADDYLRKSGQSPENVRKEEKRGEEKRREREETAAAPPGTPLSQESSLTEERREVASKNCPTVDPKVVFQKFVSHHRAKATIATDWDAMWAKWTLDEREPRSAGKPADGRAEPLAELHRMHKEGLLTVKQQPGESQRDFDCRLIDTNERRLSKLNS